MVENRAMSEVRITLLIGVSMERFRRDGLTHGMSISWQTNRE